MTDRRVIEIVCTNCGHPWDECHSALLRFQRALEEIVKDDPQWGHYRAGRFMEIAADALKDPA